MDVFTMRGGVRVGEKKPWAGGCGSGRRAARGVYPVVRVGDLLGLIRVRVGL